MKPPDPARYAFCSYFLSGYLSQGEDADNFPPDEPLEPLFQRYENTFAAALKTLGVCKESLRRRSEFNFDSGDAANLESGIAVLRTVEALRLEGFSNILLVQPKKNGPAADIFCEKGGHRVCCEVKAITKQSSGRDGFFLEDQLYEKILENLPKAIKQLNATAADLRCEIRIFACVVNWSSQSMCMGLDDYQQIVTKLERNGDQESLVGIEGVLFVLMPGLKYLFLNEAGKCIDT
jgi:hypothetical protein